MSKEIRVWLHGLIAAVIGGASATAGGALGAFAAGITIWDKQFWAVVGGAAIFGAMAATIAYLRQSPLPPLTDER